MKSIYCDRRFTCILSSCCSLATLQGEVYFVQLVSFMMVLVCAIVIGSLIISSIPKERKVYRSKPQDANLSNSNERSKLEVSEYVSDRLSANLIFYIYVNVFMKTNVLYLIVSKLFHLTMFKSIVNLGNTYSFNTNRLTEDESLAYESSAVTNTFLYSLLELCLYVISFKILYLPGQFFVYYKKNIFLFIVFSLATGSNIYIYKYSLSSFSDGYLITSISSSLILISIVASTYTTTPFTSQS